MEALLHCESGRWAQDLPNAPTLPSGALPRSAGYAHSPAVRNFSPSPRLRTPPHDMPPHSPHPPTRAGPLPGSLPGLAGATLAVAFRSPLPSSPGRPVPRALGAPLGALCWGRSARSCGLRFLALSGRCEWSNSGLGERKRLRRGRTAPSAALILAAAALALREAAPPAQMAKGSKGTHGDPCWVVEEREDGANVNNWHWCGRSGAPAAARGSRPSGAARTVRPLRILAPCALGAGRAWPHLVAPPGPRALPLRAGLAQVQRIPFPCLSCFKGSSSVASGLRTAFGV